jgi:diadenosine tetraphosphate (Ap4A) HIT family hydrolase
VPRLKDLNADELATLMTSVQRVGNALERAYKADGLTVACQVIKMLLSTLTEKAKKSTKKGW